jgi:3-oxoacyl-[acyl-carrier protein] reductase
MHAVVTGASSGIGREIAIQFASAGCKRLLIHGHRNLAAAQSTADQARKLGSEAIVSPCDFSDIEATERFIASSFETLTTIDAWIHCAGADVLTGEAADGTFQQKLRTLIEVDLFASICIGRSVGGRLRTQSLIHPEHPAPSMIFIGWDQATEGMEGDAGQMFSPVKAGVEAFAKSLAQEVAPRVRVNVIAPGWIKTAWGQKTSDYWNERASKQSLMNRWGRPEDVAAAALFLTMPTSQFFTGQTLQVNGGWNRRFHQEKSLAPPTSPGSAGEVDASAAGEGPVTHCPTSNSP